MNRRDLITAVLPGAIAGVFLSGTKAAGAAPSDTPILTLFRQHRAIMETAAAHTTGLDGADEDEEMDRLFYSRADRIEAEMMALPCTCAADFAAKVLIDTVNGGIYSDFETGALWKEARALVEAGYGAFS